MNRNILIYEEIILKLEIRKLCKRKRERLKVIIQCKILSEWNINENNTWTEV